MLLSFLFKLSIEESKISPMQNVLDWHDGEINLCGVPLGAMMDFG